MQNQIRENLRSLGYKGKRGKFKDDVISLLNDGVTNLSMFPGVADNIYKKAYVDNQRQGLTAILNGAISEAKFFLETMNLVLKSKTETK